ncbi:thioredoxin family protein [Bacillus massiliigorillae]|uniref:thioredoxin family protein n=1 Tax=Bacillus massiliigorillae TaxID=1243664 RepID=UPI0003A1FB31|nr:thioredoxin family protein [Bacillus massiliigorillae]
MKKVIIFLAIIVVLFAGIAIMNNMQNKEQAAKQQEADEQANNELSSEQKALAKKLYNKDLLKSSTIAQLEDKNYQNIITPKNLEKKLDTEKQTFVYFFSPECSHCVAATPKLMTAAKDKGINVNQYNLNEFEDGWDQYNIESTPTLVVYEDGKEVDRKLGDDSEEAFNEYLAQHKK